MKKIIEYFYIFSKLSLSFGLLICLIGMVYILYLNYKNEEDISQIRSFSEEKLNNNINKNSLLIEDISEEIKITKSSILEINKNIADISKTNGDFATLKNNIKQLNDNFDKLSKEIEQIKFEKIDSPSQESKTSNIIYNDNDEIIDLILIKYQNGIDFNSEIDFLKKSIKKDKNKNFEKILLKTNNPYKGHEYIKDTFNKEVNNHLKNVNIKNPNSVLSKIFWPYVEISPSSENKITDDLILKIKEIKLSLNNNNLENALSKITNIENHEKIFELSYLEISKYLDFKNELLKLK